MQTLPKPQKSHRIRLCFRNSVLLCSSGQFLRYSGKGFSDDYRSYSFQIPAQKVRPACCTSFSAFLMLLYNPFYLFSLGFQLSYLAVFTLAFALPCPAVSKIEKLNENKRYERIAALLHAAAPLFIIQAGMAPASHISLPVLFIFGIFDQLSCNYVLAGFCPGG